MIVLDASVVVELLTNGPLANSLGLDLAGRSEPFIVPHLLDVEVVSALRSLTGRPANRFVSERATSHGACSAPRAALCAHTFAEPSLGTAAQLHRL